MSRLSDIQLVLLSAANQRPDGSLLPPPTTLNDQAAHITKSVTALIKRGLATEAATNDKQQIWREDDDQPIGVFITEAGKSAISASSSASKLDVDDTVIEAPTPSDPANVNTRPGTKIALVIEKLSTQGGTTLEELTATTSWLPHTVRAALTGLRKRGFAITRNNASGVTRYAITATQEPRA